MIQSLLIAHRITPGRRALCLIALGALCVPAAASTTASKICKDWDETCIDKLIANPPMLTPERLPKGYKIGRCLLEVEGKTRISGPCAYIIHAGGSFLIEGPRQVFDGIDYPESQGMADMISTDWWADVFKSDGGWTGYSNEQIGSVHGQESRWGALMRNGACYSNTGVEKSPDVQQHVRVCLWKK